MNADFMRLLAERLERVSWMDTRDSDTWTEETFDGVDGFFMSADTMTAPARCKDSFTSRFRCCAMPSLLYSSTPSSVR